jgi:thymidylate synthase (FAD)
MNVPDLRLQARKNRQSSVEMTSDDDLKNKQYFQGRIATLYGEIRCLYNEMIFNGIAKECARAILPLSVSTVIIMTGSVRSWIHYIQTRCDEATQKEHRLVALECRKIFCEKLPIIAKALNWCG